MSIAFQIGIHPAEFWMLTPREMNILVNAFAEKQKRESEQQVVIAYLTAYWHRFKRMPNLKEILGQKPTKKPKTAEQMLEDIKRLNASMGGTVT
jgi:hypothetical protein